MITDVNPFVYSRPVAAEDVIDRDSETEDLLRAAAGGHFVRLYAPRKFGKTSLLRRVLHEADRREGMVPILVDLYGVLSIGDVAIRIERAYAQQLKGPIRAKIDSVLKTTGLGLSLGGYGIGVKLQTDPRIEPLPALHALLDLPLRLGTMGGWRALIVLDEFQDVTKVNEMDAILRSHIQHQGDLASYVFSGSEPGLMRQLFENRDRPLYGQAVPMRLARLADPDIAAYIVDRFRSTERDAGDALNPLLQTAKGHPQRAMLLAYNLWAETPAHEDASVDRWLRALERTLGDLRPELEARWQRFTPTEQKTLRAIVAGEGSPYRDRVLKRLDLNKASAQEALRNLEARAEVESEKGYAIVDPLFALYVERLGWAGADEPSALGSRPP